MSFVFAPGIRSRKLTRSIVILCVFGLFGGCSVAEPLTSANANIQPAVKDSAEANAMDSRGPTITIDAGGPADTVRAFCKLLREKKFREAIFLTNLRPAIEGLTDTELKDFSVDFEAIAGQVPADVEINGEIITGDKATVTANLPAEDGKKKEVQSFKLSRENGVWIIMTADEESAKRIKQDGKNYFYNLRIETHEEEARKMLERISNAELAYSLQNGFCTDIAKLVLDGLLPDDVKTSDSTGYNYVVNLTSDKKSYYATATPAVYGKSGKLSYILQLDGKGVSHVTSKDNGGQVLRK